MIKPARPENEAQRLEALRSLNVLDTPAEERYDRILRELAERLDVPLAYLATIDADRQWIKSEVGGMVCEGDRDTSFCGHTILGTEPLIVPDAERDRRFADNPMVTGPPHLRFYAGFPLTTPDGHNVGSLSVADCRPRQLDAADLEVLGAFAARVQRHLNAKPKVFISYSHRDEEWKDRLVCHLSVLQKQGLVHLWDDRRIGAGDAWHDEIVEAMESSSVAVLLVSANFLTSKFILEVEVPRLLARRDREGIRIVPVVIKPCAWKQVEWLQRLNLYPADGRPLSAGGEHEVDSLLTDLASTILEQSRQAPKAPSLRHGMRLADASGCPIELQVAPRAAADPPEAPADGRPEPPQPAPRGVRLAVTRTTATEEPPEWFAFRRQRVEIGRNPACGLPLNDEQKIVSCRHAAIAAEEDGHYLTDLGSKNFTYLNGESLEPDRRYRLEPGDVIGIAEFEIRFEVIEAPVAQEVEGTAFEDGYLNPFQQDALVLANVLQCIAERYDREAPGRRDDALEEAIAGVLEAGGTHPVQERIARLLAARDDRPSAAAPAAPSYPRLAAAAAGG